ncbi:hypothetical protein [Rhizobacter sp. Root1221]|uniref:hypothetical protein n=1 Tax=Rhizobacter sp. Root1221 TaxID=1736433 RepID=UPI0006FD39D2|nr:hypothetical protein [Rhizobacter sp. Root1221]KQV85573.1 hypothetical protein ASC87_07780 [Rhizobacter sp. Root1221]
MLLPYRRQFVVVSRHYLDELGVPADLPDWPATGHDLVAAYASPPWLRLCAMRLRAPLATWFATAA